jgi:hypothetical protein
MIRSNQAAEDLSALLRQRLRPRAEGARRRLDRADRLSLSETRDLGDDRPGRRIGDRPDPFADPFSIDQAFVFEQCRIGEFHLRPPGSENL